jgi:hypothetical protein
VKVSDIIEGVAGPKNCWPGYRKTGTQPGTGKNAGKRVNDCEKIKEDDAHFAQQSKKMQDAINMHLRKGKSYADAAKAAKMYVKEASGHIPTNKKEAEDPRWSNAITVDIGPDEDKKQASKMGFNISDAGPPKLNANGKF